MLIGIIGDCVVLIICLRVECGVIIVGMVFNLEIIDLSLIYC